MTEVSLSADDKIAVVLPCYRVRDKILGVVEALLEKVDYIIAVDDCCPESSGKYLQEHCRNPRLKVVFHKVNQGVGGAMITGFKAALKTDAELIVKMDGDGQMDSRHLPALLAPLKAREADFAKGNRFYDLVALQSMPRLRRFGNFGLTLLTKASSGFWNISDPTNGFVAIRRGALRRVNFHLLDNRYFFEISLLIQLNVMRAIVVDVPMPARYADEKSSLNPWAILCTFPVKLWTGMMHRIWWRYFIYDINIVTIFLITGCLLFFGGAAFGAHRWSYNWNEPGMHQGPGTVAFAMLPMILGFQMLLQAVVLDMIDKPTKPLSDLVSVDEDQGEPDDAELS